MQRVQSFVPIAFKWLLILVPLALAVGSASALLLWSLRTVTEIRFLHPWLLYFLPVGGLATGLIYHYFGDRSAAGNNLLIDEIHQPGAGVPRRMAPLILVGTLLTHLFGGSAGREGTAVQMGGSIAGMIARWLRLDAESIRTLLMAGVAAGFGSVFGTPIAGTVFALEVLIMGRVQYDSLIPCFFAALLADWTTHAWGVHHLLYQVKSTEAAFHMNVGLLAKVALAGALFGMASWLFATTSHRTAAAFKKWISYAPLRPVAGGLLVIALFWIAGTPDYLGIGDISNRAGAITIPACFTNMHIPASAWAWKLIFTVVTLSSGMKGGEVTPLFFIGAALGNTLGGMMGVPVDLFAALGFVAVFAGATNTPLASTILGLELFGGGNAVYIATACIVAYCFSGNAGIYSAQRTATPKFRAFLPRK